MKYCWKLWFLEEKTFLSTCMLNAYSVFWQDVIITSLRHKPDTVTHFGWILLVDSSSTWSRNILNICDEFVTDFYEKSTIYHFNKSKQVCLSKADIHIILQEITAFSFNQKPIRFKTSEHLKVTEILQCLMLWSDIGTRDNQWQSNREVAWH